MKKSISERKKELIKESLIKLSPIAQYLQGAYKDVSKAETDTTELKRLLEGLAVVSANISKCTLPEKRIKEIGEI